jgi:hypothetical protein
MQIRNQYDYFLIFTRGIETTGHAIYSGLDHSDDCGVHLLQGESSLALT